MQSIGPENEELALRLRVEIFSYLVKRVGTREAADDITQETFAKVGRALGQGVTPEHFRGWLYQIARNASFDFLKKEGKYTSLEEPDAATAIQADATIEDSEFRKSLFSCTLKLIESLPPDDRLTLLLTEIDGLNRDELARHLRISLTAAKSRVLRARSKFRRKVEECCRLVTDRYGRIIDWQPKNECACPEKNSATQSANQGLPRKTRNL